MSADQPTVLPWHREAAKETYNHIGDWAYTSGVEPIAAIIARHDEGRTDSPALRLEKNKHAATLRLLEEIDAEIQGAMNNAFPEDAPDILDAIGAKIRAHLAALSKPSAMQQYAKQEGRQ